MILEKFSLAKEICFSIKESILERNPVTMSSMKKPLGHLSSQIVSTLERSLCWMLVVLGSQNFLPPFTGDSTPYFLCLPSSTWVECVTQAQLSCRFLPSGYSCWFICQQMTQDSPVRIPDQVNNPPNVECGPGHSNQTEDYGPAILSPSSFCKLLTFVLVKSQRYVNNVAS